MKPTHAFYLTTALTLAGFAAQPLTAQAFEDRVMEVLVEEGFDAKQTEISATESRFEAVRGDTKLDVIYDRATGRIVGQETETFEGTVSETQIAAVLSPDADFDDVEDALFGEEDDAVEELREDAAELGLSDAQTDSLQALFDSGGAVDFASLAAELGVPAEELEELQEDYADEDEDEEDDA